MTTSYYFCARLRRLRREWFHQVEASVSDDWVCPQALQAGEADVCRYINKASGEVGYAKPGPAKAAEEDYCRAAHEKIAFDLAYLAGLPVGPVVLWRMDAPDIYKRGRAISCEVFARSMDLAEYNRRYVLSVPARENLAPVVAAMRVFHAWIGDYDRRDAHIIVDLRSSVNDLDVSFIDHADALSRHWSGPNAGSCAVGNYMQAYGVPERHDVMVETAEHIASLSDTEIGWLIDRIPAMYLPEPYRSNTLRNLLSRKHNLRAIFQI